MLCAESWHAAARSREEVTYEANESGGRLDERKMPDVRQDVRFGGGQPARQDSMSPRQCAKLR